MAFAIVRDFFNKLTAELDKTYYPLVGYYHDNKNTQKIHHTAELFSNGCLTYSVLIERLASACKDTKENIHVIVSKFVEDFDGYEYDPNPPKKLNIPEPTDSFGDFLNKTDFAELKVQKSALIQIQTNMEKSGFFSQKEYDAIEGVVNFISSIQDIAVDKYNVKASKVFKFTREPKMD